MRSVQITVKYSVKCFECDEWIMAGSPALLFNKKGIKCVECITGLKDDDSRLVVIEPDEEFYLK